jgi:hypothetical protein
MKGKYIVDDLRRALTERSFPTITLWNRLEGRPRRDDFDRALKAEVRDALWMLTKQWQIGEFRADDAGSPVFAKTRIRTSPVTRYRPAGGDTEAFDPGVPLETKVERRPLPWESNDHKMHLDLRAQLGRHWRRMLGDAGLQAYRNEYLARYPITLPAEGEESDYVYAHPAAWQEVAALAGRCMDGGELYLHLTAASGRRASDGITVTSAGDAAGLDALGVEFVEWVARMYSQPGSDDAWRPPYLEYQFSCSAPRQGGEQPLVAEEYAHGHLDWYSVDRGEDALGASPDAGEAVEVSSFMPVPVTFEGMPDPRWWALEDRKTDFGSVKPSTTDVAQLLLIEFGLVFADDWFLTPFRLPAGVVASIEGLAVTNNFGERFWIEPAPSRDDEPGRRWSMFQPSPHSDGDRLLFLPTAVATTLDGAPLEEVELTRDETANMVWAIERVVPTVTGRGRSGKDEARGTRSYHERLVGAVSSPPAYRAPVFYDAMTGVPENFIPFVPVHVEDSVREVQLQRSRMLRIIEGDPFPAEKVPPRTTIVREGLDRADKQTYLVHEEEVPRSGIRVTQSFRRTRWTNGETFVWLGLRKQTGSGEGSSDLSFDNLGESAT